MNATHARLALASLVLPTSDDWLITVNYTGWDGKRRSRKIAVVTEGGALTSDQAVERALNSLRKSLKTSRGWEWQEPPKIHGIDAEPYTKERMAVHKSKYEEMLARFRATLVP